MRGTYNVKLIQPDVAVKSTRYSCQILMKLEFYGQVFEKS